MHELLLKNIIKRCRDYADEPSDAKRMPNIGDETAVVAIADLARQLETANGIIRSFSAVCDRSGSATNWEALSMQVRKVLAELETANGIIRSFSAVCDRSGSATNWEALSMQVRKVLAEQHRTLHAEQYVGPRAG